MELEWSHHSSEARWAVHVGKSRVVPPHHKHQLWWSASFGNARCMWCISIANELRFLHASRNARSFKVNFVLFRNSGLGSGQRSSSRVRNNACLSIWPPANALGNWLRKRRSKYTIFPSAATRWTCCCVIAISNETVLLIWMLPEVSFESHRCYFIVVTSVGFRVVKVVYSLR